LSGAYASHYKVLESNVDTILYAFYFAKSEHDESEMKKVEKECEKKVSQAVKRFLWQTNGSELQDAREYWEVVVHIGPQSGYYEDVLSAVGKIRIS